MKRRKAFAQFCPVGVGKLLFAICLVICTLGLSVSATAQHLRITTFNVKRAGTSAYQGTFGIGINPQGEINGFYIDAKNVYHGFLRSPEGVITTFDAPDAGGYGTFPFGLNSEGATVGYYNTPDYVYHGFLRRPDGTFAPPFTNPDACTTSILEGCEGTAFYDINLFGVIAGGYADTKFINHGLVMYPNGDFTNFDAPGAGDIAGSYQGTYPDSFSGLNDFGAITGNDFDTNNVSHGFLRSSFGGIFAFEAPGAGTEPGPLAQFCTLEFDCQGTYPTSINDFGVITGDYVDSNNVFHGFLRNFDGTFTDFDATGADTTDSFYGTIPENINDFGAITGYYLDASGVYHGFLRSPDGKFTKLDAPGADMTPGNFNGTFPFSNNLEGAITGYYVDVNNVYHGFVAARCDQGCFDNDSGGAAATGTSPATTTNRVNQNFPGALNSKLRLLPWNRNF
jgi:hypothetical protein